MKKNRKFLTQKAATPRLSKLLTGTHDILTAVSPEADGFLLLLYNTEEDSSTRIVPLAQEQLDYLLRQTEGEVTYIARTDENHNLMEGEEK